MSENDHPPEYVLAECRHAGIDLPYDRPWEYVGLPGLAEKQPWEIRAVCRCAMREIRKISWDPDPQVPLEYRHAHQVRCRPLSFQFLDNHKELFYVGQCARCGGCFWAHALL